LIIDLDNNVWSFGNNVFGQLGLGDNNDRYEPTQITKLKAKAISAGGFHNLVIDMENNIWSVGINYLGQLGLGRLEILKDIIKINTRVKIPNIKAKAISAGYEHNLIIDLDNNVWSFGNNKHGQLGLGVENIKKINKPVRIPNIKARVISSGRDKSLIIQIFD